MNRDTFIRASNSFSEFFERAKTLSNKDRGDAFERLVELHLKSKPKYASQLKSVWQLGDVPSDIRKKLALPNTDEGIDLIAEHQDGTYWAIQAKFRGDPTSRLSWGEKGGLSTFTSLAFTTCKNISFGLVVATTEKQLRKTHLTGPNVAFELYGDLVELDDNACEGWKLLQSGLKGKSKHPKKLKPRPHQTRAINNAKKHFGKDENSRGKLIMPCGTGKSLTGFWITQALEAKEIVVAVPSLALIKQTLNTWTREFLAHGVKPEWMAVCSDASAGNVDEDSFTAEIYDMGVPCETDPDVIAKFLRQKCDVPRVVFTTYQSGKVLAQGATKARHKFDLGIMDEAHKTVGRKDKMFAHLLDDKNIKIDKRISMTATERFYRGNSSEIVSMDDPEIYGDTFDLLTFRDAIEKFKIICGYRFVTVGIAQSEITALWENNDYLRVEGAELDEDTTRSLASGIALRKAYAELGVKRAISFHRSIKLASRFKKQQEQLTEAFPELTEVDCFHVSSQTSTGERNNQLRQFANAKRGLITNARCLTEGVDIPSVDCVLFADPRQSKVDIVQAAGRAMRQSKDTGKEYGFIIVPMVVPDDVDLEEFAKDTAFANVVTIIKALAAEDERIVEYLRTIASGATSNNGIKIETEFTEILAEKIDADTLLKNVELKVWERVAKLNWRPFEEARSFVRSLKINSFAEWLKWCGSGKKPADIPWSPSSVYRNDGWAGVGDWLGTGRIADRDRKYRAFKEARAYAQSLNLKSANEWRNYVKLNDMPDDIPRNPNQTYRDNGWVSFGDWLGTGRIADNKRSYRKFTEARKFVHSLKLKSNKDWLQFCSSGSRPSDIPAKPERIYARQGFIDMADWLGVDQLLRYRGKWREFEKSRNFVRKLQLNNLKEWQSYCASGAKPSDIPSNPSKSYKDDGWKSFADWLGNENELPAFPPFDEAKKIARALNFHNFTAWRKYTKSDQRDKRLPVHPHKTYKNSGWVDYPDWLGYSKKVKAWRSFEEARNYARSLELSGLKAWQEFCQSGKRPEDIPSNPQNVYKNTGWKGYADWLGNARTAQQGREYRDFSSAREYARKCKLNTVKQWRAYSKKDIFPSDIPKSPDITYKNKGWMSWNDWLGKKKDIKQK